jgi:hypothetical protein
LPKLTSHIPSIFKVLGLSQWGFSSRFFAGAHRPHAFNIYSTWALSVRSEFSVLCRSSLATSSRKFTLLGLGSGSRIPGSGSRIPGSGTCGDVVRVGMLFGMCGDALWYVWGCSSLRVRTPKLTCGNAQAHVWGRPSSRVGMLLSTATLSI